jgi:monofunctional biosynthetic peptidoglycan transglycosylase
MSLRSIMGKTARIVAIAALALACLFAGLVALYAFEPPVSTLMVARKIEGKVYERTYVRLKDIAPVLVASVIASEDARFCRHDGVDWGALREVMSEHRKGGPSRGASTITMQTAKNLFLWPGRSTIRKGVEIAMALILDKVWSKARTIEIYLNIAEWGDGLFGIEAAAEHYFHKSARELSAREAALLAAALPNPIKRDASHPSAFHRLRAASIVARAEGGAGWLECLPAQRASPLGVLRPLEHPL